MATVSLRALAHFCLTYDHKEGLYMLKAVPVDGKPFCYHSRADKMFSLVPKLLRSTFFENLHFGHVAMSDRLCKSIADVAHTVRIQELEVSIPTPVTEEPMNSSSVYHVPPAQVPLTVKKSVCRGNKAGRPSGSEQSDSIPNVGQFVRAGIALGIRRVSGMCYDLQSYFQCSSQHAFILADS